MKGLTLIACGITIVCIFGFGISIGRRDLAKSQTKKEYPDWFNEASYKFSPEFTDHDVDVLIGSLCKAAIHEHQNLSIAEGAERVGVRLYKRLSAYPVMAMERNHAVITQVTIDMLGSPYSQNVFEAQKFIMNHLESEWGSNLAKDYVKRFRDIDYMNGRHTHPLNYFLPGANEVGAHEVIAADGTRTHYPESSEYSNFAKFVVDNAEELAYGMAPNNAFELNRFVQSRKATLASSQQVGTEQPATRPESESVDSDKPQPEAEGRSR